MIKFPQSFESPEETKANCMTNNNASQTESKKENPIGRKNVWILDASGRCLKIIKCHKPRSCSWVEIITFING